MVTVTLTSVDTLTRGGGRVDIPGLSMDGHSYSGICGYSDREGGRVDIPGLSIDGHTWYGHALTFVPVKSWVTSK